MAKSKKNKQIKSLYEELMFYTPNSQKIKLVESNGDNLVNACINYFNMVEKDFSSDQLQMLESRFLSAIRNRDVKRFERGIKSFKVLGDDSTKLQ